MKSIATSSPAATSASAESFWRSSRSVSGVLSSRRENNPMLKSPPQKLDFTIAKIDGLFVAPEPRADGLAAIMVIRDHLGGKASIGLMANALQELNVALIENSPRTPGTP